ncbi:aromatic prenyltransferase [Penicillium samsonianum]|uniref:aromatic prenyltransferase n=1 Tax=Penicillium samsonianum TaxID=1882272 RepID=UPI002548E419|nr:aromatic prenyltransferase [Penicillium samsonianum]KAJ6131993.1 aromatic prenyltransferase [Penicillium samsonianum]
MTNSLLTIGDMVRGVELPDADQQFWWDSLAPILSRMLQCSKYSVESQANILSFFKDFIVPSYGPRPSIDGEFFWKSYVTYNHTPGQVSFNFHKDKCTVRLSNVPTAPLAGTASDPFNQKGVIQTIKQIQKALPDMDMTLFDYFSEAFLVADEDTVGLDARKPVPQYNQLVVASMLGYDFEPVPRVKVYFNPRWKALQMNIENHDLIWTAINNLGSPIKSYKRTLDLLQECGNPRQPGGWIFQPEFISFDLAENMSNTARLKLYGFTTKTCWSHIENIYTLDGRLNDAETQRGLAVLKRLWHLALSIPEDHDENQDLPPCPHLTAGVIYNYELRENSAKPEAKIYIPVRFYGSGDGKVIEGLVDFFKSEGWDELASSYQRDFVSVFSTPDGKMVGEHHDISFSYKNDHPYVTAYYRPELIRPMERHIV